MGNLCSNLAGKTRSSKKSKSPQKSAEPGDNNSVAQHDSEGSIEKRSCSQTPVLSASKDTEESSKNGFVNKEANDRPVKSIKFAEAPEYFKLKMAGDVDDTEIPNSKSLAQQRIDQKDKFFDPVALNLCQKNIVSFDTLIFQLIHENANVKTDLDKVRAVFTWLTNKNTMEAHFEYINNGQGERGDNGESPDIYLHGLCTGRYTYAQFFQLLCKLAGVRCKLLRGYAKGNDFKPGMKLQGGKAAQHAWNSVEICGVWYLFDTHWTARRLAGRNNAQNKSSATKLDLFYFMIHPEDMMYSHFPFETAWQLLNEHITLETFEKLAIVKPAFFKYRLSFSNNKEAILSTNKDVKIDLKYPLSSGKERLTFTYTMQIEGKTSDSINEIPLTRYGMLENFVFDRMSSMVRFWIRFPESGSYKIMIFAKSMEDQLFSGVCEYLILADTAESGDKAQPFPPTQQTTYGKTELLSKYNITSTWGDRALFESKESTFEVVFNSRKKPDLTNCPRLMARLKNNSMDDNELSKRLLIRIIAPVADDYISGSVTTETIIIKGYLPQNGEYALEIYANNPDTEASSFFLIWQHLIVLETQIIEMDLPKLSPGFLLGAQDRFKELCLRSVTHRDPLIIVNAQSDVDTADVSIRIALPVGQILTSDISKKEGIRILGQLMDASQEKSDDENETSNLLLQQAYAQDNLSHEVEFLIRLDGTSTFYKLYVYAMSLETDLDTVPLAMTFLIQLKSDVLHSSLKGAQLGEFPQQTSQWKEDCRLICPMGKLITLPPVGSEKNFEEILRLIVPHAMKVAAVINEDWVQLTKSDNGDSEWTTTAYLTPQLVSGSTLTIFANFNSRYNSYIPLLEYILQQ